YGSDLDLIFVYDDDSAGGGGAEDAAERHPRPAPRGLPPGGTPPHHGPRRQLHTRPRPPGHPGRPGAAPGRLPPLPPRHPHEREHAESWERQALVKARACAGDPDLGARVIASAHAAAYERGAPPPEHVHHLRTRMEREIGRERVDRSPARYDLKVGRGGLVDV